MVGDGTGTGGLGYNFEITYRTTSGAYHAYDYMTRWDWSEYWVTDSDRCNGDAGCLAYGTDQTGPPAGGTTFIPADPDAAAAAGSPVEDDSGGGRYLTSRGSYITDISEPALTDGVYGDKNSYTSFTVSFVLDPNDDTCRTENEGTPAETHLLRRLVLVGRSCRPDLVLGR